MFPPKSPSLDLLPLHSYTHILLHRNPNSVSLQKPKHPKETIAMETSSVKLNSRKRKKQTPSFPDPLIGIFTRSKSQIYFHGNRSRRARLDGSGKTNFDAISVSSSSCPEKPQSVTEPVESCLPSNDEINSAISSVKDLRAHRVFSPVINPIIEEERKTEGNSKFLQSEDLDADSGKCMDLTVGDKMVEESKQTNEAMPTEADMKENNIESGLNLKKDEAISTNGSASRSKTVLNPRAKRKIFKTPNSFSYRRLLPYVMDIVKGESGVSEIEVVDVEFPNKLNESTGLSPKKMSIMENNSAAKLECARAPTNNPKKRVLDEEIQKCDKEEPCILQMSSVGHQLEHRSDENGTNGVESLAAQHTLMKPDADILSETVVREDEKNTEVNSLLSEKPDVKCTSVGCVSICNKSCRSPNGKSGNHGKTEPFLTPCPRLRVFKAESSFSYRRLLPYLIDVAKENSCNSKAFQNPKPQIDSQNIHQLSPASSDEGNPTKEIRLESFSKQSHTEDKEQNLLPATPAPVNGSSSDTADNLSPSTPPLHSTSDSSKVDQYSVVSASATDQMMPLDLSKEGGLMVQNSSQKSESEIAHSDTMDCDGKSNCSAVQSCSVVEKDILTEESCSKDSESQPVDKEVKFITVSEEAHKSDKGLIQEVNSSQSQSHIEVSDTLVAPTDGPLKGILKRNPRGCRGPCNCLNCASFRLHAERAFEFSTNQMLDAEEVAYGLMKELAHVRHILEKSAVNENGLTTIQLNEAEVNQVCNQALETETLAKERLNKLNYDLNVHCRIPALQRPIVSFSNHVQERVIPKTDKSTSPEKAR